jgi:2',3'-cyclic-nucleotide 2'-phosphodiesterase (5'-nucleotidase family)
MVRRDAQGTVLVLDAGNSLIGQSISVTDHGRLMVQAMNAMGYDALAVGRGELAMGLDVALARASEAAFPFLSANLVNKVDRKPIFEPSAIVTKGQMRIGIIGLTHEGDGTTNDVQTKATVLDPVNTASRMVAELRNRVDVLVVLSRLGREGDQALAKAVPGINVIVGGRTRALMPEPDRVGDTLIIQQGYSGEWLGELTFTLDKGVPIDVSAQAIALTDAIADDPDMASLVARTMANHTPAPQPTPTR